MASIQRCYNRAQHPLKFRFAKCCQFSINCTPSIPHVCNLTACKNQVHKRRRHYAQFEISQKGNKNFFKNTPPQKKTPAAGFSLGRRPTSNKPIFIFGTGARFNSSGTSFFWLVCKYLPF